MATITIDPGTSYQTHERWELGMDIEWLYRPNVQISLSNIIQQAVDWGINSLNPGQYCGLENPTDRYLVWYNNGHTYGGGATDYTAGLRAYIYETKHTTTLGMTGPDDQVNQVIIPFRAALAARGEEFTWVWRYVAYTGDDTADGDGTYDHATAATFADFVGLLYQHFQATFGFWPTVFYIINEPDNGNCDASWQTGTGTAIGDRIKAAGDKLVSLGFPGNIFEGPCTMNASAALTWYNAMKAVSGASAYIRGLDTHLYDPTSWADNSEVLGMQAIRDAAAADGIPMGSGEMWPGSNGEVDRFALWSALYKANMAWWEPTTLPGLVAFDSSGNVSLVTTGNTGPHARYWVQFFKYIRPLAVRKGSTSSDVTNYMPVAYECTNGKYVVVVNTNGSVSLDIDGLPDSTYGISYTTATEFQTELTPQVVSSGSTLTASIPAAGVISIYDQDYLDIPAAPGGGARGHRLRFRN